LKLLSIDPSIVAVGVASLENGKPLEAYTLRTDNKSPVEHRLRILTDHFTAINKNFDNAIVEMPDKFVRYGRVSMVNFASLQLLHLAIGAIVGALVQNHNIIVNLVRVADWKGNSQKWTTQDTVKLITGMKLNTHEADALLMGIRWTEQKKLRNALVK
jgi:Holliday junction resolvasome RuvABC endonuclease subunit